MKNVYLTDAPDGPRFSTTDLVIASVLGLDYELVEVVTLQGGRLRYDFRDTPDIREVVNAIGLGRTSVEPVAFATSMRRMRSYTYPPLSPCYALTGSPEGPKM